MIPATNPDRNRNRTPPLPLPRPSDPASPDRPLRSGTWPRCTQPPVECGRRGAGAIAPPCC